MDKSENQLSKTTNVHVFMPMTANEKAVFEAYIHERSLKKGEWLKRLVLATIGREEELEKA